MKQGIIIKPLSPNNISVDCKVWLDGADSSTFTLDGNYVNQWSCKGSLAAHVYNTNNDTTRPTYDASTGRVTFIAANSMFLQSAAFGVALSQPNTVFVVYKITGSLVGSVGLFDGRTPGARNALAYTTSLFVINAGIQLGVTATNANDNIHVALFNGASSSYWINGVLSTSGAAGANTLDGITLGEYAGGGFHPDCEIMEVIVYNSLLPFHENYGIYLGLKDKWSI